MNLKRLALILWVDSIVALVLGTLYIGNGMFFVYDVILYTLRSFVVYDPEFTNLIAECFNINYELIPFLISSVYFLLSTAFYGLMIYSFHQSPRKYDNIVIILIIIAMFCPFVFVIFMELF